MPEELKPTASMSLKDNELLGGQNGKVAKALEKLCRWRRYAEGEKVFDRDDTSGDVYFVVEGSVRAIDHAESGQEVVFVDIGVGEVFGELSAIDGQPRSAMIYALEDCVLAVAPGETLLKLMREHPAIARRMLEHVVKTIRVLNSRVVGLSSTTVVQRVYEKILDISEPDPMNPKRRIIETLPAHKEIAVWASTTPESVARAMGRLIEANVVKRRFKTLHILDPNRLQALIDAT